MIPKVSHELLSLKYGADLRLSRLVLIPVASIITPCGVYHFTCVPLQLYGMIQTLVVFVSIYTMVLMSLDRFLAVVHPISSMHMRSYHTAAKSSLLIWLLWGLVTTPLLFIADSRDGNCRLVWDNWFSQHNKGTKCYLGSFLFFPHRQKF